MIRKLRSSVVGVVTLLSMVGCGVPPEAPGDLTESKEQRITTAAPSADLESAVQSNTDFGLELYRQVAKKDDGNVALSPHSVSVALSMSYVGAAGSTATAFENTLQLKLAAPQYHRAMNELDRTLASRGVGAKSSDGKAFRLDVTNQLFAQKGFGFEQPYLDTLAKEYGAGVRLLDFATQPEPSRVHINTWVEKKTEDRIKNLLEEGLITVDTRAVLVNAVYFNAAWKQTFKKEDTVDAVFHAATGDVNVKTMKAGEYAARAATVNGTEVVELPYDGDELSMVVLMPPQGQSISAFEQSLTAASLKTFVSAAQSESLTLSMPQWEARTSVGLNDPLQALGLGVAFSGEADFSAMTKEEHLYISDVVHQTFVKVNEAGTEAAAATAVVFQRDSVALTRTVTLDRPFLYLIRDVGTGAVVFIGRVAKP